MFGGEKLELYIHVYITLHIFPAGAAFVDERVMICVDHEVTGAIIRHVWAPIDCWKYLPWQILPNIHVYSPYVEIR